jgi:hypothetical protein
MEMQNNNTESKKTGYDTHEANVKFIVSIGLVFILILAGSIFLIDQIFTITKEKDIQQMVLAPESITLRDLRSQEDEILNSYGVIDTIKGVYRIPISRAMELIADEAYQHLPSGEQ